MRVAQVIDAGQQCTELAAIAANAANRNTAETDPVIAALAPDQPGAAALAACALIGERDLERAVHRLGTRIGEEYPVQPRRHQQRDLRSRLEGQRMDELKGRGIVEE